MTSATLYREGPDLDELLADLDAEHAGQVRVVDVNYGRDGGVMGFFARRTVGVHYTLDDAVRDDMFVDDELLALPSRPVAPMNDGPLDALLRAAEAAEIVESGRLPEGPDAGVASADDGPNPENVEFARMLLDLATKKAAEKAAAAPQAPLLPDPITTARDTFDAAGFAPILAPVVAPVVAPVAAPVAAAPRKIVPELATRADLPELTARIRRRPVGAHRVADGADVGLAAPIAAPVTEPAPAAPAPIPTVTSAASVAPAEPARTSFTLRRQLVEIGVPVAWIPGADANAYQVVEQLVRHVPLAADFDPEPGQLLVVVGPATHALGEATRICARLRIDPACVRTAGCGPDPLTHRRQAASLAAQARCERDAPLVVVVATDAGADDADPTGAADLMWATGVVAALAPDHLLAVVDATSKPADARAFISALGGVSALAVVGAGRTASPAAVWDLGAPVRSIDGRPATRGAWAALLIDRLADLDVA